jgi:membrane protein implicated in regulation of membrane protease activity
MHDNMKRPVKTGSESLVGKETKVASRSSPDKITPYRVHIEGEIWGANSKDRLEVGEKVVIIAVEGTRLLIKHKDHKQEGEV